MFSPILSLQSKGPDGKLFACLFGDSPNLEALAKQFSPLVEKLDSTTVVFSIGGLERLIGDTEEIASEICRRGQKMGLVANLAIAANPETAALAARNLTGVTLIRPGRELEGLAQLPVEVLPATPEMLLTFERWGIHSLADLAALPELGIVERLGQEGLQLRRLAVGQSDSHLKIAPDPTEYIARRELEYPVKLLEPVFFILSSQLRDLTERLRRDGQAAGRIALYFQLEGGGEFRRALELPFAMRDPLALLKQVQLSLEAHPPEGATVSVEVKLDPVDPRSVQGGLFAPPAPDPEKLHTLISRLHALAGKDHVGTPEVLDTYRPDAYRFRPCALESFRPEQSLPAGMQLAIRYIRPPAEARVVMLQGVLRRIRSRPVSGEVIHSAGPWRSSGEWWAKTAWNRDEWDVMVEDRSIHRIYRAGKLWFVEGTYD